MCPGKSMAIDSIHTIFPKNKRRKMFAFKFVRLKNRYPLKVSPNFSLENLRQNFGFRLCCAQILFNLKFHYHGNKNKVKRSSKKTDCDH